MRLLIAFLSLLFLLPFKGNSQVDTNFIVIKESASFNNSIAKKTWAYIDFEKKGTLDNITTLNYEPWKIVKENIPSKNTLSENQLFFKFTLLNQQLVADTVFFYGGNLIKKIQLYSYDSTTKKLTIINQHTNDGFVKIIIAPNFKLQVYGIVKYGRSAFNYFAPNVIEKKNLDLYQKNLYFIRSDVKTFGYVLSGILLMMIFFTTTNFYLSKKIEFLYYTLYSICIFFIVFFHALLYKTSGWFSAVFADFLDFVLILSGTFFYIQFFKHFLNSEKKYITLHKIFNIEEKFILASIIAFGIWYFTNGKTNVGMILEDFIKIVILIFGIIFTLVALKQKDKIMKYFAWGNGIAIIFWCISLGIIIININAKNIFTSAIVYYEAGLVMSLIAFLLGLTYKNRIELIESTKEQESLKLEAEKQKYETEIAIFKAQQEERNRISADMHDDLGAGMTSIRLYSELAKGKLGGQQIPEIEKISTSADELLSKMNAIIWSMASSNDTLDNMIAYLRAYALEYFEDTSIKCITNLPKEIPHAIVSGYIRRNVFLVVKEALNNILKHSNATQVTITLLVNGKVLTLLIHDNGKGIDFNNLRQFSNGLKNMKKRMDDVEIDFKIENKEGTLITLTREIKE